MEMAEYKSKKSGKIPIEAYKKVMERVYKAKARRHILLYRLIGREFGSLDEIYPLRIVELLETNKYKWIKKMYLSSRNLHHMIKEDLRLIREEFNVKIPQERSLYEARKKWSKIYSSDANFRKRVEECVAMGRAANKEKYEERRRLLLEVIISNYGSIKEVSPRSLVALLEGDGRYRLLRERYNRNLYKGVSYDVGELRKSLTQTS